MNLYDIVKTKLVCENRMEHRDTKAQSFFNFSVSLITPYYKSGVTRGVTRLALIR